MAVVDSVFDHLSSLHKFIIIEYVKLGEEIDEGQGGDTEGYYKKDIVLLSKKIMKDLENQRFELLTSRHHIIKQNTVNRDVTTSKKTRHSKPLATDRAFNRGRLTKDLSYPGECQR